MKKSINPSDIVAVIDSREHKNHRLDLSPMQSVIRKLEFGDYSVRHLEPFICIERKSLPDLVTCVGRDRARFEKCVQGMLAYPCRAIVVEASWKSLEMGPGVPGGWRGEVSAAAVQGSVLGWIALGVPVLMAHDHITAGRLVARMLYIAARRRWEEGLAFVTPQLERARGVSRTGGTFQAE